MNQIDKALWSTDDSADLYGLRRWSNDYFDLNGEGLVTAKALNTEVPLLEIVQGMEERDLI